ncbi:MAG TPA: hypothetical protein VI389_01835 [Geobacteraceae bacterium]
MMLNLLRTNIGRAAIASLGLVIFTASVARGADLPQEQTTPPVKEKCGQSLPPLGLYSAANDLLEAALYAQWVLEDIVCKDPKNEEARKALTKLDLAITKAEGK